MDLHLNWQNLTDEVERIVRETGKYALDRQSEARIEVQKTEADYATDVDLACEKIIRQGLEKIEPKFPIFTEEEHTRPDADVYWVVDPIDGTKNYLPGLPLWSINIALYDSVNKEVLLGVVYFPRFDDLFRAWKNGGSFLNGKAIRCSETTNPDAAKIYVEPPNKATGFLGEEEFQALRQKFFRIRTWGLGSALCYVASGALDAFFDFCGTTQDYDVFAPLIIAKEAGCKILEFDPEDQNYSKRIIRVSNGKLGF